ncbi:hypothetical protein Bbelb_183200 [Branchiostoma belcheri]|nr:hypothetical protein Bbelb_183200 [Branchiostoma belcheri]
MFRGICYKAFATRLPFFGAVATCRQDGGTLAIPRDAEINAFLASLPRAGDYNHWIGLQYRRTKGVFEWMDGSARVDYHSWDRGKPNKNIKTRSLCFLFRESKWRAAFCTRPFRFMCQIVPSTSFNRTLT